MIKTTKDESSRKVLLSCYRLSLQQPTNIFLMKYYLGLSVDKQNE